MTTMLQKTFTKGFRKALLTRLSTRRWAVARGWADETTIKDVVFLPSKRSAMVYVEGWLNDQ